MAVQTASDLITEVEAAVASGELLPGARLPSVRHQADRLGLAPNTVAAAYRRLRERGVVVGRGRQGTIVAALAAPAVPAAESVDGLVDAATGTPDPRRLPSLARLLPTLAYDEGMTYGQPTLLPALAVAARTALAEDGIDATHLTVANGAMDAIERALDAQRLTIGDRVGVEDPGHGPVHQLVRRRGLELVAIPVDDEGPTPEGIGRALDLGIRALIVTPRAQNPTGAALTTTRAAELSDLLSNAPDLFLVHDDHAGPVAGCPYVAITPPGPRWATVRSLAKTYGPDLRMALIAGDAATIGGVDVGMRNGPGWVSHILQSLGAHLLADEDIADGVAATATSYTDRRRRLIDRLTAAGVTVTGVSGLNVWVPVADEQSIVDACRAAGFAVRAAARHRLASSPAVRVTISTLDDRQLDDVADALVAALRPPAATAPTM